jgi:hypothetical protein
MHNFKKGQDALIFSGQNRKGWVHTHGPQSTGDTDKNQRSMGVIINAKPYGLVVCAGRGADQKQHAGAQDGVHDALRAAVGHEYGWWTPATLTSPASSQTSTKEYG